MNTRTPGSDDDAARIARLIVEGFDSHYRSFRALSASAKRHFERSDWRGMRAASRERIGSYNARVTEAVAEVLRQVPSAVNETLWPEVKRALLMRLLDHQQPELAETFYNSVACRVLQRGYFTNQYLFWRQQASSVGIESFQPVYRAYSLSELGLAGTTRALVMDLHLLGEWEDLERDLRDLERALGQLVPADYLQRPSVSVQVLTPIFYRRHAAYVLGRVHTGPVDRPFSLPVRKTASGQLALESFLSNPDDLAGLISLSRAYFMADMEVPSATVDFLRTIFPARSPAELYTSLGLQKQGKTLFYRELMDHLRHTADRFVIAPGIKGMVMCVFTLPSFPWVFKVIRDRFDPPKDADRAHVKAQYLRVKLHDRVGRMADTWEFSDVGLPLSRISEELLAELEAKAPELLEKVGERLLIKHLYIERRLTPLDLYLQNASPAERRAAIIEYGEAITELAQTNIFPGDLLLKNFGVSRQGRVIFYDYDEIAAVTECVFRGVPTSQRDEDEYASEAWFSVGPRDIFPEELPRFLFSNPEDLRTFLEVHGDLATPGWWLATQARLNRGEEADVKAYPADRTFAAQRSRG